MCVGRMLAAASGVVSPDRNRKVIGASIMSVGEPSAFGFLAFDQGGSAHSVRGGTARGGGVMWISHV
jgi:hypothetical protein